MEDDTLPALDPLALKRLAARPPNQCVCHLKLCQGWESVSDDRWPAHQLSRVGTLRPTLPQGQTEPTFEEFHPHGTRYESPEAPISVVHFPFNRCDVYACRQCGCAVLKYTEYGGYYVDHRVRLVQAALIVDTPNG